ncbi:ZIP family metal transporter [Saliphagus infecundisoli]|uniref:ZIP family metal transporter n=1 Tax=Saliphagus infecundisoli TaxID=1849069 RepID=A0ABD5QJK3_9EURY|nr:ZIP family metal transporter [Saliphagus infecundisoli]
MSLAENLAIVFVAGLVTALATGIGALPFLYFDTISDRRNVVLWGIASGVMVAASTFGLLDEGLAAGTPLELGAGIVAGVVLVVVARRALSGADVGPRAYAEADRRKLALILGVLTVHSFPEGVAIGVSFADLGLEGGLPLLGITVPLLALFMTVAISIHNVPEGTAIAIPLRSMGIADWRLVWWAIFSSLPQPVGAVLAFAFVRLARDLLAVGFGFAAGAMIYLVASEFVPEAREIGEGLPGGGLRELAGGFALGVLVMVPLLAI